MVTSWRAANPDDGALLGKHSQYHHDTPWIENRAPRSRGKTGCGCLLIFELQPYPAGKRSRLTAAEHNAPGLRKVDALTERSANCRDGAQDLRVRRIVGVEYARF